MPVDQHMDHLMKEMIEFSVQNNGKIIKIDHKVRANPKFFQFSRYKWNKYSIEKILS